jgi:FKBP-type peptidyl-prolyl cis-trans isomerase SlyD
MVLEDFEKAIMACEVDGTFDFTIPADRAYGEYDDESVIDLPKNIFEIDGKIDDKILFEGNIVPLQDNEGNRINASVVSVGTDTVTVDLNHPLAGENLHFVGKVLVKREASMEEIQQAMQPSCGGCGGNCGGGCSCDSDCSCGGCE